MTLDLPLIWAALIAFAVFAYVLMDGFDLGVGILFATVRHPVERDLMVNSIAPVWDGNETWLVFGGGGLFAVFPLAYATLLPALYMPLTGMLLALIFRGVSFEMRFRARNDREQLRWDRSFQWGSYAAAFCQGICLGAVVQGIKVEGRGYAGGWWDWLSPFSLLTGISLVTAYGLLGACWLIKKSEGELQRRCRRLAYILAWAMLGFIGLVSWVMVATSPSFRARWFSLPAAFGTLIVPLALLIIARIFFSSLRRGAEGTPFLCALGFFLISYAGLLISLWPMMVPPRISIWQAAAPVSTQGFLLVGAAVFIPITLSYTALVYYLFRGKVRAEAGGHT
jgi:cytochrome d ubiquinol oxidase subunit II